MSRFVDEHLIEGALWHELECGHVHPAQNGEDALPIMDQRCERCETASLPN